MYGKVCVSIFVCALLLQACALPPTPTLPPEPTAPLEPTLPVSAQTARTPTAAVPSPLPSPQPTATAQPTPGPTATVWPPVFDFYSLQDIRTLDSFLVTVNEKNTVNGQLTELTNTIGYIQEPFQAYNHNQYYSGMDRTYVVGGWTYTVTGSGDWYISSGLSDSVFLKADIPAGNTEKLVDAQFAGQEDFQGIPAYHFVLSPTAAAQPGANTQLEGDFYLAQQGNYVLYSHWKETSSQENFQQVYEVTQALSSINQLGEIKMPADMEKMVTAAELPVEMRLPLPGDSALNQMIRYKNGIGVDLYYFSDPNVSKDQFLEFYRQMPETDGWQVTHVGHVNLHQDDCEFSQDCVMIQKGNTQVILYFNGATVRAEFDWPRLYSPL